MKCLACLLSVDSKQIEIGVYFWEPNWTKDLLFIKHRIMKIPLWWGCNVCQGVAILFTCLLFDKTVHSKVYLMSYVHWNKWNAKFSSDSHGFDKHWSRCLSSSTSNEMLNVHQPWFGITLKQFLSPLGIFVSHFSDG